MVELREGKDSCNNCNMPLEKVLCRSMVNWSMAELLSIQHEKTNWSIS